MSVFGVIQLECGKTWTRITPNTDTFHAVVNQQKHVEMVSANNVADLQTFLVEISHTMILIKKGSSADAQYL